MAQQPIPGYSSALRTDLDLAARALHADTTFSRRTMMRRFAGVGAAALAAGALGSIAGVRNAGANTSGTANAAADLNLRAGPSTSHQVLRVIPAGGSVILGDGFQNGFRYVTYDGQAGWAHGDYLVGGPGNPGGQPNNVGRTTDALNLREQPNSGARVLLVMPANAQVNLGDQFVNGYRAVTYNGTSGWAYNAYLTAGAPQTPPPGEGPLGGNGYVTTDVNLRDGASLSSRVILVIPAGGTVFVGDQGTTEFWGVSYNGVFGWVWREYLVRGFQPGGPVYDPNVATTTAALNLRAEPSLSARVLTVMPSGSRVDLGSDWANGFRQVTFNGTTGWAATDYLN
jgi:uncharacterized protein YraI